MFSLLLLSVGAVASTTLVTFVDCKAYKKMAFPLANKACYASKHGYSYRLKVIKDLSGVGITYRKPGVVVEALLDNEEEEEEGSSLIWMDADVVVMNEERRFEEFVRVDDQFVVQMTDHNCNPNNGVVAFSRSWRSRLFAEEWQKECRRSLVPFTDQGCFYQQVIRTASNRSLVSECRLRSFQKNKMRCVMKVWDEVFGRFDPTRDREANGVRLRRAQDGFNNHCCEPSRHQQRYCQWYDPPGWNEKACFAPGMFAMHGRNDEIARGLGLPQANFDTASLASNLSRCVVKKRPKLDRKVSSICSSSALTETWMRV